MKLNTNDTKKDELNIGSSIVQNVREKKFIGSIKMERGQKLFELNLKTGDIKLAEFKESVIEFPLHQKSPLSKRKELIVGEDCMYRPAINLVNAKRKFQTYIDRVNQSASGRSIKLRCPECEADQSVIVTLSIVQGKALAKISMCEKCGHQPKTLTDFVKQTE